MRNIRRFAFPLALVAAAGLAIAEGDPRKEAPKPKDDMTNPITGSKPKAAAPGEKKEGETPAAQAPGGGGAEGDKAKAKPAVVVAGGISFEVPTGWVAETPTKSMFTPAAQFKIPAGEAKGADDASVKVFTGIKGGVGPNIERWKGQFSEPGPSEEKDLTSNGVKVHTVVIKGTFGGGMMGGGGGAGSKKDYMMLGAIATPDDGDVQIKIVGPAAVLDKQREAFDKLVKSIKPAK